MKAFEMAVKVFEKFGTPDVFVIAEKSGVKIVYESWQPVTIGEYDKKAKTICVNLRALTSNKIAKEAIVAHELGHFFAAEFSFDRQTEEAFAAEFAAELLKINL